MAQYELETLIILAGPSASGKTTLAFELIEGRDIDGIEIDRSREVIRIDAKTLLHERKNVPTIILEYAINQYKTLPDALPAEIVSLIDKAQKTYVVTLKVDSATLARRYIRQLFAAKARSTPKYLRIFQFRKLYRMFRYRFTDDIDRYYSNWAKLLDDFSRRKDVEIIRLNGTV